MILLKGWGHCCGGDIHGLNDPLSRKLKGIPWFFLKAPPSQASLDETKAPIAGSFVQEPFLMPDPTDVREMLLIRGIENMPACAVGHKIEVVGRIGI